MITIILTHLIPAHADAFELGVIQKFTYVNDVSMYDLKKSNKPVAYRISGTSDIAVMWKNSTYGELLKFHLQSPKFYHQKQIKDDIDFKQLKTILDHQADTVCYALRRKDGIVEKLFLPNAKDSSLENFARAFVSLFQFQLDGDLNDVTEEDVSGSCQVTYVTKTAQKFMKFKTECSNDRETFRRPEKPLDVTNRSTRVTILTFKSDGKLENIHSTDHHRFEVNSYPNTGLNAGSLFFVESKGEETQVEVFEGKSLVEIIEKDLKDFHETSLHFEVKEKSEKKVESLVKLIKDHKENLATSNVGKSSSANSLLQLLESGRQASQEDLIRVLKAKSMQEIRGQLLDLYGAIQTVASHEAVKKVLNFTSNDDFDMSERYFTSLAIATRPIESVLADLIALSRRGELENAKLADTLVQTISSMANKLAHQPTNDFDTKIVVEVKNYLLKSMNKCADDDECKLTFIRGLGNLRSPDTLDKLLHIAENFPYKVSVSAMKSLKKFNSEQIPIEWKDRLRRIFLQSRKKFDSSARAIALDLYTNQHLNENDIAELIEFLRSNDSAFEMKQYLIQKLKYQAMRCDEFNRMLTKVLNANEHVNNWNVFGGAKGLSTVLQGSFSGFPSVNTTLLSVQEIKGGVLKRGDVDLILKSKDQEISLFTLGLFAGGLSSFMSSNEEVDPDEDATATAGMELSIQNVQLRPLVFFNGQGELMGHVWSGTASTPTTAYQGITMLQDFEQSLILNNGVELDVAITGAMSIDLNGKMEISLWYKNANSEVVQRWVEYSRIEYTFY